MNDYANAVLSGRQYRPDDEKASGSGIGKQKAEEKAALGDVGVELARLNYGIVRLSVRPGS